VLDRIPVDELAQRAGIPEIVSESTSHMAASFIDLLRRIAVGLDAIVYGTAQRLVRRQAADLPERPRLLTVEDGS
jgi:hypothetical protein